MIGFSWCEHSSGAGTLFHWDTTAEQRASDMGLKDVKFYSLPYPASPYLNGDESRGWPNFCFSPKECKGRTSCPKSYACSE